MRRLTGPQKASQAVAQHAMTVDQEHVVADIITSGFDGFDVRQRYQQRIHVVTQGLQIVATQGDGQTHLASLFATPHFGGMAICTRFHPFSDLRGALPVEDCRVVFVHEVRRGVG